MKIKALISGVTLGISTMANANVPHLDPHALPTLRSLIEALNDWESPINATSSQAANAETHANNAESYANSALQTATSANSTAQQAATTVKTFDSRLITAEGNATSAKTAASSANEQAANASQTAQAAFAKANSYENRISVAEKNASEAQQTANTAKQTADNIKGTADEAKQTADKASELANSASETANMAKTTADNAKSSADRVDQFDQRITEAQESAKEAQESTDTIEKNIGFTMEDRVIYGHKGQSLQDLINKAQNDESITPKLDSEHPVVIKLAPITYDLSKNAVSVPQGIIIDGEDHAILKGGNLKIQPNTTFENFKAVNAGTFFYLNSDQNISTNSISFKNINYTNVSHFISAEAIEQSTPINIIYFENIIDENVDIANKKSGPNKLFDVSNLKQYVKQIIAKDSIFSAIESNCSSYISNTQLLITNSMYYPYCTYYSPSYEIDYYSPTHINSYRIDTGKVEQTTTLQVA